MREGHAAPAGVCPAAWYGYPENTDLAANIVTALEALGLLRPTEPVAWKEAVPVTNGFVETDRTGDGRGELE